MVPCSVITSVDPSFSNNFFKSKPKKTGIALCLLVTESKERHRQKEFAYVKAQCSQIILLVTFCQTAEMRTICQGIANCKYQHIKPTKPWKSYSLDKVTGTATSYKPQHRQCTLRSRPHLCSSITLEMCCHIFETQPQGLISCI